MRRVGKFVLTAATVALAGCGGTGSLGAPSRTPLPAVVASASPTPTPAPTPAPQPTPTPAPVAKVTIAVIGVVCNGEPLPGGAGDRAIEVGCKAQLDLTAKDVNNKPYTPESPPRWTYEGDLGAVRIAYDDYSPILNVVGQGHMTIYAEVDGLRSNVLDLTFFRR